jgi:hypothetical protein
MSQDGAPVHGPKNDASGGVQVRTPGVGQLHCGSSG